MDSRLNEALKKMYPQQRKCCKLYYLNNWTQAKIAKHIGTSQPNVSQRIKSGKIRAKNFTNWL